MRPKPRRTSLPQGNKAPAVVVDGPFAETKEYALCSRRPRDTGTPIQPRAG